MAFFGKRASPSRSAAGSTDTQPPRQKILPDEVWQGEISKMLRTLGMSPDDEQNLVPTPASIDARIARDKAAHEARWAALNRDIGAKTNGGSVRPFFLIPEICWNGETGHFLLVTLGLSPYEDWNVAFLPADKRTADILGLPMHPNSDIPWIVADSMTFMRNAMARYQQIYAEVDRTHEFGLFKERMDDIRDKTRALAVHILKAFGEDSQRAATH